MRIEKFKLLCGRIWTVNPLWVILAGIRLQTGRTGAIFKKEGLSRMDKAGKILIVIGLIAAIGVVIIIKQNNKADSGAVV